MRERIDWKKEAAWRADAARNAEREMMAAIDREATLRRAIERVWDHWHGYYPDTDALHDALMALFDLRQMGADAGPTESVWR